MFSTLAKIIHISPKILEKPPKSCRKSLMPAWRAISNEQWEEFKRESLIKGEKAVRGGNAQLRRQPRNTRKHAKALRAMSN
jgi:hypothetical protein